MLPRVLPELWDSRKDRMEQLGGVKKRPSWGLEEVSPAYQPSQGDLRRSLAASGGPDRGALDDH